MLEQYRSDYNGHHGGEPNFDGAVFGSKGDAERRHRIETLTGDFQTLAQRADILIKIQERLRKLFKRDLLIEWDGGNLKISFSRIDVEGRPYSSGREASGLMHLIGILAALYDDDVGALLLDEPEVSLHPQLQAFLLKEILGVAGYPTKDGNKKIVVIATHSTEMLQIQSPDDLLSLVFCYDLMSDPVQIPADAGELKNRKIQGLVARLGQEHKLSLFSKRPLLVEGPSDQLICSALANKLNLHLEAAGSQLLPVIGKGQLPVVAKLLRLLGKTPVTLADADGIADGLDLINSYLSGNEEANSKAARLGAHSASQMASSIYGDFCRLVDEQWAEISEFSERHPYWINRNEEELEQARRRSAFSTLFNLEDSNLTTSWTAIKNRFVALLDLLEECGLFVLRKGSIESYYLKADRLTSIEKPSAAVDEIEHLNQMGGPDVQTAYADVVRCIRHASGSEVICEADALRDLLLSVVAPAHARFREVGASYDYNGLARSILGERARIFDLSVKGEALLISIESKILDVAGFPVGLHKHDDVVRSMNAALGNNS